MARRQRPEGTRTDATNGPERTIPGWVALHRGVVQATIDIAAWAIALVAAVLQRHDFNVAAVHWAELGLYLLLLVGLALPLPLAVRLF